MAATTSAAPVRAFDRRLLPPMMLGAILNPINSSIIAVALAPIAVALGAPASQTAWLISALYLATAVGQPLAGRLVDMFGPKRMFVAGGALTGAAGVLGALAPDIWTLVAARVILGFGTCAGYPAAMYLIRSEGRRTGMTSPAGILTALSIATQTILVIGPSLGGLLIDVGGWRSTLAVNIPLGVASLILGWLILPPGNLLRADDADPETRTAGRARRPGIDWPGVALFSAALLALLLFLMNPHAVLAWLVGVAAAAGTGFVLRELRYAEPFIDVRVFAGNLPLLATYARTLLAATVSYAFIFGFTQWLEVVRGLSASATGLILLPTFGVGILVAALTGRRQAVANKLLAGSIAQLVACALLLVAHGGTAVWLLVVIAAILGIPQGLVNLANQNALYHQAQPERIGASAGLLRTFMYLGAIAASSAAGLSFGSRATTGGLHTLALVMVAAAVALLAATVIDRSLRRVGTDQPAKARVPAPREGR